MGGNGGEILALEFPYMSPSSIITGLDNSITLGGRVGDVLDEFVVESVGQLIGQMEVNLNVPFN